MSEVSIGTPFNEVAYGGDFSWSLDFNFVMFLLTPDAFIPLIIVR
jgi:hypothetical protein